VAVVLELPERMFLAVPSTSSSSSGLWSQRTIGVGLAALEVLAVPVDDITVADLVSADGKVHALRIVVDGRRFGLEELAELFHDAMCLKQ
jgi:hypothetical protein